MSPWSLCCFPHYWSFDSPSSSMFLAWLWRHGYFLPIASHSRSRIFVIAINYISNSILRLHKDQSSVLSYSFSLQYSSQFCYLWFVSRSSFICRWHSTFLHFCHLWILHQHLQATLIILSPSGCISSCMVFLLNSLKSFITLSSCHLNSSFNWFAQHAIWALFLIRSQCLIKFSQILNLISYLFFFTFGW